MVYLTGDTHTDWMTRLSFQSFPEGRKLTKDDFVIVLGDFGIWKDTKGERYHLDWLDERPFTTLFLDGNHENFDRLYSDEFPLIPFHGGIAQRVRPSVYHLLRGEAYTLENKVFYVFGGASSHDISDGILQIGDPRIKLWQRDRVLGEKFRLFRVEHESWRKQELPSEEEITHGRDTLDRLGWRADYILSHCAPIDVQRMLDPKCTKADRLMDFLQEVYEKASFDHWFFGHYHMEMNVTEKMHVMYRQIFRLC
ncbi:MAG: metallophosphoesterase [Lachnospiraceae bacterium]|nr:metallophosphoesterase [Lachnospiraceae bacterium]